MSSSAWLRKKCMLAIPVTSSLIESFKRIFCARSSFSSFCASVSFWWYAFIALIKIVINTIERLTFVAYVAGKNLLQSTKKTPYETVIRSFADLDKGLQEMCRVLKSGGHLSIVELTTPVSFPMKQLFHVYSHTVLPIYGRLISRDTSAYSYLTKTIEAFPQGERMVEILQKAGFSEASFKRLTFGICTMYFATK